MNLTHSHTPNQLTSYLLIVHLESIAECENRGTSSIVEFVS